MNKYSKTSYKQRDKVETCSAFFEYWRRIATRYDRCVDIFMAAITIAASIISWKVIAFEGVAKGAIASV